MRFFIFFISFFILAPACIYQDPYQQQSSVIVSRSEMDLTPETKRGYKKRSLKRSGYQSSSRPRFASRNSAIRNLSLSSNPNLNIEDYLDTAVYIYGLIGICDSSSTKTTHKTCVETCTSTGGTIEVIKTCIGVCDTANNCRTGESGGSGVFASQSTILTNHHVIKEAVSSYDYASKHYYNIYTAVENYSEQKTLLSSVEWYDDRNDIALGVLAQSLSGADVPRHGSLSRVRLGEELFTIGSPDHVRWTASKGHLTNKNPGVQRSADTTGHTYNCTHCITFSIPIGGGNSGGPVFDSSGRLLGLVAYSSSSHPNLSGGPHIDRIKHLLSSGRTGDLSTVRLLSDDIRALSRSRQRALARTVKELVLELR